ncbi:MAG: DegT/DnrJ/EryC1/StrS family aminotransferase [Janthinobacterium lividum]
MTSSYDPNQFLPFVKPQIDDETMADVVATLRSGWITTGPKNREFEAQLSARFGGRPVRTFNSGTATLEVALRIAGVGPGDEVITTPLSWVATSNVVYSVGATPVFADIDPLTRNLDLTQLERAITPRTKAIIPVYLAGLPVDMERLYAIARQHGLRVVEDAAQAMGSSWDGQLIGAFGDLVSFSFHANKNMTSIEGGALVLNNEAEALLAEKYRLQGVTRLGVDGMDVDLVGGKFNLSDVAAAVGLGQLRRIDAFNARRAELATRYFAQLAGGAAVAAGLELPPREPGRARGNWHMFQVVLPDDGRARAAFMNALKDQGIGTGVHYPAIHLFTLYRERGFTPGMFPHAERVGARIVTLPLFPSMHDADVDRVCAAVNAYFAHALTDSSQPS